MFGRGMRGRGNNAKRENVAYRIIHISTMNHINIPHSLTNLEQGEISTKIFKWKWWRNGTVSKTAKKDKYHTAKLRYQGECISLDDSFESLKIKMHHVERVCGALIPVL